MDCFDTYSTHVQTVQTCDEVHIRSATEWTASVYTLHMSKPVITFVFEVLYNGLLLRHVDFSLSFMFEITRAGCYVMSRVSSSYISVHMGHSRCSHLVQHFKWKKSKKNENHAQKVLKSEMLGMLVLLYCKLHRNLMTNENVMWRMHGKTHTK